jgi:hypothetical protein
VAFEPTPVWIGATPGEVGDEALSRGRGRRVRIAGPRVRTERVSRASAVGPAAQAFTSASATPSIVAPGSVETVKTGLRPASRAALRDNLGTRPASEAKPRLGAVGSTPSGRAAGRPGAIAARATPPAVDGVNPGGKRDAKARPKTAEGQPAAKPKPKPAASR